MSQFNFGGRNAILQLASQAGIGQRFQQQAARDRQIVGFLFQRQAQRDALALEREKLRFEAQAQRTNMQRTSTRSRSFNTPFTRSVDEANAEFKQTIPAALPFQQGEQSGGSGRVSGDGFKFQIDEAGNFSGNVNGQVLSDAEVRRLQGNFVSGRPAPTTTPLSQFKQSFLQNVTGLSERDKQALSNLVLDENIDLNDFTVRVNQLRSRTPTQPQTALDLSQQLALRERAIRSEADDINAELEDIDKIFEDAGVALRGRRAADTKRAIRNEFGGGSAEAARLQALVAEREKLLQRRKELRTTRQNLFLQQVQQVPQQTQQPPSRVQTPTNPNNDISDVSNEELLSVLGLR